MKTFHPILSSARALCVIIAGTSIAARAANNLTANPTPADRERLTAQLKTGKDDAFAEANAQMRLWLSNDQVPPETYRTWLPLALAAGRFQDVADLSLIAVAANPDLKALEALLTLRYQALLALNKTQDALQAAKSAYCLCDTNKLPDNIDNMADCLAACHSDDPEIKQRFKNEQSLAMFTGAGDMDSTKVTPTLFQSIQIDAKEYEPALEKWKAKAKKGAFRPTMYYANLLLAAGRASEAQNEFGKLFKAATTPQEFDAAMQGIVRCLRAQDGNDARANNWLAELQRQHLTGLSE